MQGLMIRVARTLQFNDKKKKKEGKGTTLYVI
jgi:hypothetical protein